MWDKFEKNPPSPGAAAAPALDRPALSAGAEARVGEITLAGAGKGRPFLYGPETPEAVYTEFENGGLAKAAPVVLLLTS